ncbi:predicted protein [Nematostella vectensis]|uniref:Centromere protein H C-terminal domain-containing protein n=1 Tax=Nematostella vectensis TaxID=45351 RepID=A7RSC2_NEMVE|nr:predicted protein [Nematostella vectensis]|eukprot:XP_001637671.1 predicted protein [Nematostella vectensis]
MAANSDEEVSSSEKMPFSVRSRAKEDFESEKEEEEQQKLDHDTQLTCLRLEQAESLDPGLISEESTIEKRISRLQDRLFEASAKSSYQKALFERLVNGDFLIKKLFPDTVSQSPTDHQLNQMREYGETVCKYNELCSEILRQHQAMLETQQELDQVKQQSLAMKKRNRELMAKLKDLQRRQSQGEHNSSEVEAIAKAKDGLNDSKRKLRVVGNIFQGLIVGSGINWAADDSLRQLMIELGEIVR